MTYRCCRLVVVVSERSRCVQYRRCHSSSSVAERRRRASASRSSSPASAAAAKTRGYLPSRRASSSAQQQRHDESSRRHRRRRHCCSGCGRSLNSRLVAVAACQPARHLVARRLTVTDTLPSDSRTRHPVEPRLHCRSRPFNGIYETLIARLPGGRRHSLGLAPQMPFLSRDSRARLLRARYSCSNSVRHMPVY